MARDQAGSAAHFDSTQRGALFAIPPEQPEQPEQPENRNSVALQNRNYRDDSRLFGTRTIPCPVIGVVCPSDPSSSFYWANRGGCPYGAFFEVSPTCIERVFGELLPSSWPHYTTAFDVRWCRGLSCRDRKIRMWNNGHWRPWTGTVSRDGWKGRIESFGEISPDQWAVGDTLTMIPPRPPPVVQTYAFG